VLREGEILSVANFDSSEFPIAVRLSGYLAASLTAPLPDALFANGFED